MRNSILVALNDSESSRAVLEYLAGISLCSVDWHVSLIHFFRKPTASEDLMGKKFTAEQPEKMKEIIEKARSALVESGYKEDRVETELITEIYPTVADGIIDQVNKRDVSMVVIGRKKLSKAEEFIKGDISIKLVRALEDTAILVVKTK